MSEFLSQLNLSPENQINLNSKEFLFFDEMKSETYRKAAVCILIYKKSNDFFIGMIKRNTYKGVHSKQIGFAGGKFDETDNSLWDTAKREVFEEIGIKLKDEHLLGKVEDIFIDVSNFKVRPYIVFYPNKLELKLDEREVRHFVEVPLHYLFDESRRNTKTITTADNRVINAKIIQLKDDYIWGASYLILEHFKSKLRETSIK